RAENCKPLVSKGAHRSQSELPAWREDAGPATAGQGRKPRSGGARAPALRGWRWSGPLATSRQGFLQSPKLSPCFLTKSHSIPPPPDGAGDVSANALVAAAPS